MTVLYFAVIKRQKKENCTNAQALDKSTLNNRNYDFDKKLRKQKKEARKRKQNRTVLKKEWYFKLDGLPSTGAGLDMYSSNFPCHNGFLCGWSSYLVIITSFKTTAELYSYPYQLFPNNFDLRKIADVWNAIGFGSYFANSIFISIGAAVAAILFNGMIAYVLAIVKPWGHKVLYAIILLSYMIPTATNMVPLFKQIADIGLIDSHIPLILVWERIHII